MHPRSRYTSINSLGNITKSVSDITFKDFPDFGDISLACYCHRSARFCCIFDGLCVSQKCRFPPSNCLIRYIFRPINFPNSVTVCITELPSFVQTFITALLFSIFSICFQTIFTNSGQRMPLLK